MGGRNISHEQTSIMLDQSHLSKKDSYLFNLQRTCMIESTKSVGNRVCYWGLEKMIFTHFASLSCLLIAAYLHLSLCQAANCNNCCSNTTYKEINEPRRSIKSVWKSGERALCDRGLKWGWYRFTSDAGGKIMMPEKSVPEHHCGTHDPIWLNGRHPTVGEGTVARKACVRSFSDDCVQTFDINIRNCGDYYVYYLRPLIYCYVAYCAGELRILY